MTGDLERDVMALGIPISLMRIFQDDGATVDRVAGLNEGIRS
jgi:hypothetical protein